MADIQQAPEGFEEFAKAAMGDQAPAPTALPTDSVQPAPLSTQVPDVQSSAQQPPAVEGGTIPAPAIPGGPSPSGVPSDAPEGFEDFAKSAMGEGHDSTGEQIKAVLEGAAQGVAGPLAPYAEAKFNKYMSGTPEDETYANLRGREDANPKLHGLGEAVGLAGSMFTGVGEGALVGKVGAKATEYLTAKFGTKLAAKLATEAAAEGAIAGKVGLKASEYLGKKVGPTLAAKLGTAAAAGALESALVGASDQSTKFLRDDPDASVDAAIANTGYAALFGGAFGGAIAGISPLVKALGGSKVAQVIEDMKGEAARQVTNPEPVESMTTELQNHYNNMNSYSDSTFGSTGIKQQAIEKLLPGEVTPEIQGHAQQVGDSLKEAITNMRANPESYPGRLVKQLENTYTAFGKEISGAENASDAFSAVQNVKQKLQGYAKYDKQLTQLDEPYDFVKDIRGIATNVREGLENPEIYGEAAGVQQSVNKAFSEYLPELKNFESKFTEKSADGSRVISPGKINTYINALGKPGAELRQQFLSNYLDKSQEFMSAIDKTHLAAGVESPVTATPLNYTSSTVNKVPLGAKLMKYVLKDGVQGIGSKIGGGIMGGMLGHELGHSELGAAAGTYLLGGPINKLIGLLAGPMVKSATNAEGLQAATTFGNQSLKGLSLIQKGIKGVFNPLQDSLVSNSAPQLASMINGRDKLDQKLKELASPDQLAKHAVNNGSPLGAYLPGHDTTLNSRKASGVQYLNSLRPESVPGAPLDGRLPASKDQTAKYNRALDIAQKPTIVLDAIKTGRITPTDIIHLKSLYPGLYKHMSQELLSGAIDEMNKGNPIPYHTKQSLSLFLGQPMDSSMKPMNIQSAQPQPQQQGNQVQGSGKPANQGQAKAFKNAGADSMTSSQAAEKDQLKR